MLNSREPMSDSPTITRHIRLLGHVQGVYFRESMCRKAAALGVTGWVRNRRDGTLEAMLQGDLLAVENLLEWSRHGPSAARVEQVEISEGAGNYTDFQRLGTL